MFRHFFRIQTNKQKNPASECKIARMRIHIRIRIQYIHRFCHNIITICLFAPLAYSLFIIDQIGFFDLKFFSACTTCKSSFDKMLRWPGQLTGVLFFPFQHTAANVSICHFEEVHNFIYIFFLPQLSCCCCSFLFLSSFSILQRFEMFDAAAASFEFTLLDWIELILSHKCNSFNLKRCLRIQLHVEVQAKRNK